MIEVHAVINWLLGHQEILALLAVIAAGVGTLYRPIRDLINVLPKFVWAVIKYAFFAIRVILWPIWKPIAWAYTKFMSDYVYNFLDGIFEWFENRDAAREKLRTNKNDIKVTDL